MNNSTLAPGADSYIRTAADDFVAVFGMLLIVFGSIGNSLAMVVIWAYKSMRQTSRCLFFLLACVDEITLLLAETRYWIKATFGVDFRKSSDAACKAHTFFTVFFIGCSVWVLSLISLERFFLTWFPTKRHPFNKLRNLVIFVALIVVLNIALNLGPCFRNIPEGDCDASTKHELHPIIH